MVAGVIGPPRLGSYEEETNVKWQDLVIDGYDRALKEVEETLSGLTPADLDRQPHRDCNSIGWTVWHLARVQDAQIADLAEEEQLWLKDGWYGKFNRPAKGDDTGYEDTPDDVRAFRSPEASVQLDYLKATVDKSKQYVSGLKAAELSRKLDEPWFQPLPTVGVRLVSIMADALMHAGESDYIRGLLSAMGRLEGA